MLQDSAASDNKLSSINKKKPKNKITQHKYIKCINFLKVILPLLN